MNRTLVFLLSFVLPLPALATVTTIYRPLVYDCDGSRTAFPFTWDIDSTSQLVVTLVDEDDAPTVLTETTHYTVSATNNDYRQGPGGTVTTVATYSSDYHIVLSRSVAATQATAFTSNADLRPAVLRTALDKTTMVDQDIWAELRRCLRLPVADYADDANIANATIRANTTLTFDSDGHPQCTAGVIDANDVSLSSLWTTILALTTLGEIQTQLGIDAADPAGHGRAWTTAGQPTESPDGSRLLNTSDTGRLWVDANDVIWYYTGSTWHVAGANDVNVTVGDYIDPNEITGAEILLDNLEWLKGRNAGNTADVNLIRVDANDDPHLGNNAKTYSSAGPSDDDGVANKKYVDDTHKPTAGATVFNTHLTAANTFQDLDLSATIGANTALVCLGVYSNGVGTFACQPKGYGGTFTQAINGDDTANGAGAWSAAFAESANYRGIVVPTSSAGVLEIGYTDNSDTLTITLWYIK